MDKYIELLNEVNETKKLFETDYHMRKYIDSNMEIEKKELLEEYEKIRCNLTNDEKKIIHALFEKFGIIQKI